LDEYIHQDGEEVICSRGIPTPGVLEQADQNTKTLDDAMEFTTRRLQVENIGEKDRGRGGGWGGTREEGTKNT